MKRRTIAEIVVQDGIGRLEEEAVRRGFAQVEVGVRVAVEEDAVPRRAEEERDDGMRVAQVGRRISVYFQRLGLAALGQAVKLQAETEELLRVGNGAGIAQLPIVRCRAARIQTERPAVRRVEVHAGCIGMDAQAQQGGIQFYFLGRSWLCGGLGRMLRKRVFRSWLWQDKRNARKAGISAVRHKVDANDLRRNKRYGKDAVRISALILASTLSVRLPCHRRP